jgi:glycosyltransferase involved in cell wall biosynthesis
MNIAFLHYHLNRGGVTRVIANQLLALDSLLTTGESRRAAVLFGGRDAGWPREITDRLDSVELSLHAVEALDYDTQPIADPAALAHELRTVFSQLGFQPEETVLHVHNHSLGKNTSLPGALQLLAKDGFGLLLQIHDFAEDFRPRNYRLLCDTIGRDRIPVALYPQAARIHYAVLNRRDQAVLEAAGVTPERLHFLPNSVPTSGQLPDRDDARRKLRATFGVATTDRYVLYPVRGIRRKNVGEALLWSLLADEATTTAITLAPLNPAEQTAYLRWRDVANELNAPFLFATGDTGGLTFEENLAAAELMLTTSVAEGFGMVFLESWLAGRSLAGRDLPEITVDFTDAGVELPNLYERLDVPLDWIGREWFAETLQSELTGVLKSFGLPPIDPSAWDGIVSRKIRSGCIDFGDLNESMQEQIIRRVAADAAARTELLERNRAIDAAIGGDAAVIERNRQLIEREYSLEPSGRRLHEVYQAVLSEPKAGDVSAPADAEQILSSFLDPTRYRLIRDD